MQTIKLKAESRESSGKGPARQLRSKGLVPAVFYGRGMDARSLAVSPSALKEAVSGELGLNSVLELEVAGQSFNALLSAFQLHPVSREILHADFLAVDAARPVNIEVPLQLVGKAKGIVLGGRLRQVFTKLPVSCLPGQIPAQITHDVSELGLEETVRVSDLRPPTGVSVRMPAEQTVGGVFGARAVKDEDAKEGEGAAAAGAGDKKPADKKPADKKPADKK